MQVRVEEVEGGARPAALRETLECQGYALVEGVGGLDEAERALRRLGRLVPQYDGALRHEVVYRQGFDDRAYSQSANTIKAHTEAPGWSPSPAWLALYCHQQARCGGGHTDLLDFRVVAPRLTAEHQRLLSQPVWFPAPVSSGARGVRTALVSAGAQGREVVRFSYNLLTSGDYDPPIAEPVPEAELPLGREGRELAERVSDVFGQERVRILVPEDGLLVWDNQRMLHARSRYEDRSRHLTRFWVGRGAA